MSENWSQTLLPNWLQVFPLPEILLGHGPFAAPFVQQGGFNPPRSLLVCPPVGVGDVVDGIQTNRLEPTFLVHDHPNDIAIRLLPDHTKYERFEALPGDTIRTFDLVGMLAPLNVAEGHVVVVACNLQGEPIAHRASFRAFRAISRPASVAITGTDVP